MSRILSVKAEDLEKLLKDNTHLQWQVDDCQKRNTALLEENRVLRKQLADLPPAKK